jgi:FkbM family methyltransferase
MSRPETADDALDQVFRGLGSEASVREREDALFDSLARGATNAVIFGSGPLGRILLDGARASGVPVVAFADNKASLHGTTLEGIPIMSPANAVAAHGADAYFVVAVYNSSGPRSQLRALGCERIVPYPAFYWRFASTIPWAPGLDLPHRIVARRDQVRAGYDCLSDETSRKEFVAQIAWRCTLDYERLPPPDDPADIYFAPGVVRLNDHEVFVDCGAFDGDSIRLFRDRVAGAYRHIYACEPDVSNRDALQRFISSLPGRERERITVLPFAVGDRSGTVSFQSSGTAGSRITAEQGAGTMECRRLDDLMTDITPTIIKMDIEGAEPGAIQGGTATIRGKRPILAVCAYHQCEHLWTLPALLETALPEYRISLRRYAEECWETVYYAVPPERPIHGS